MTALRSSWSAVHDACCDCEIKTTDPAGDISHAIHHAWRSSEGEDGQIHDELPFDEAMVDRLVDLHVQESRVSERLNASELTGPEESSASDIVMFDAAN